MLLMYYINYYVYVWKNKHTTAVADTGNIRYGICSAAPCPPSRRTILHSNEDTK